MTEAAVADLARVEVLPALNGSALARQARTTETALELPPDLTTDEWQAIGDTLGRAARASAWWVGDWINYGTARWGEKYAEAEEITGLSYNFLSDCANVAKRFTDRSVNVSWTHYYRARGLTNAEEWLRRAEAEKWSVRELQERTSAAPRTNLMPGKRHAAFIDAADSIVRISGRWERSMTDDLTPPEARKQLTVLKKARAQLDEVIEAVEYRAATLHTYLGR